MLTAAQRTELNQRILSALTEFGQGVKSSVLAEHLQVAQRDVVGRLQALKRQRAVTYDGSGGYQSAAGLWTISKQGSERMRQARHQK